jgi:methionine-rich copper-binding protein CopC
MRSLSGVLWFLMLVPAMQNPELLDSSPRPGEMLTDPPAEVSLLFDRPLAPEQVRILVIDAAGEQVDHADTTIDETNPNRAFVTLLPLSEGSYIVEYEIVTDGVTTMVSAFSFMVVAPPSRLLLLSPANGVVLPGGELALTVSVDAFDLSSDENAVRLYIDGSLEAAFHDTSYTLSGLEPGVHRVEAVLAHSSEELEDTRVGITVAVPQPDPEAEGRHAAMTAPPDRGLQLQTWQIVAVVVIGLAAFGGGIWLARPADKSAGDR